MGPLSQPKRGKAVGVTTRGKGSTVMLVTEGHGLPIGGQVTSAQPAEIRLAAETLATVRVPRRRGRPRHRPRVLVADKGYDSDAFRRYVRQRGIRAGIPRRRRHRRRGRLPDLTPYRLRGAIERTISGLGHFR